jgi:hypothetical protein
MEYQLVYQLFPRSFGINEVEGRLNPISNFFKKKMANKEMNMLKGKKEFTATEIKSLEELIKIRPTTPSNKQKAIRQKMRNLRFYGQDDWGIKDMQISNLHSLLNSGQIKIIDEKIKLISFQKSPENLQPITKRKVVEKETTNPSDIGSIIENIRVNCFEPNIDSELKINNTAGNYIICLRKRCNLPTLSILPDMTKFDGLNVIYTGVASKSLRLRDYKQHFKGNNAGRSTLRKSLGVLFGYNQIPRDKDPDTGKTKFNITDEQKLSEWMATNLIVFFLPTSDYHNVESKLINHFNPPLNIKENHNLINKDFRRLLSSLRTNKS